MEIEPAKNKVSSLHSQAVKDKEAMEEDYQKALNVIFAYGYRCYVFKHNICGDQPEILDSILDSFDPLSLEFFVSLKYLPIPKATDDTTVEVHPSEVAKEPEKNASVEDQS